MLIALFYKTHYEKGLSMMKEKKYSISLSEFNKVDSTDKNFENSKSKIHYINGIVHYNDNDFIEAYDNLSLVNKKDEYYNESILLINNIEANPKFCFEYGLKLLRAKDYKKSLKYLSRISECDEYYKNAQSKINYILGIQACEEKDYNLAREKLNSVNEKDEFYAFARAFIYKVDEATAPERIKKTFFEIANNIQEFYDKFNEWMHMPSVYDSYRNTDYFKNKLGTLLSEFENRNDTSYVEEPLLEKYVKLVRNWMLFEINFVLSLDRYYTVNLEGRLCFLSLSWYSHCQEINKERDTIVKEINSIRDKICKKYNIDKKNIPFG